MKRDKKGRFKSETDDNRGYKFIFYIPFYKKYYFLVIYYNYCITLGFNF